MLFLLGALMTFSHPEVIILSESWPTFRPWVRTRLVSWQNLIKVAGPRQLI